MRKAIFCFLFALSAGPLAAQEGDHGAGDAAVAALGQLNGVALQCQHFAEAKRIKQAMIAWAPKTVAYGTLFETSTNDGFMGVAQEATPCPDPLTMGRQVDEAIAELRQRFPAP